MILQPQTLDNGLLEPEEEELDQLQIDIGRLIERIGEFVPHRSLSLAITKLDEAKHWLRDRKGRS